jgi:ribosomal-protein-alanine N-acetyltransferase
VLNLFPRTAERVTPQVRWMITADLTAVLEIEAISSQFPWLEHDFRQALLIDNVLGAVAEVNGQVVGYMIYEQHRTGIDLFKLAVVPHARRLGVGRALIAKLISTLDGERQRSIAVVVNERNLQAHLWLRALGFMASEVLHGHFDERPDDPPEDGYRFQFAIPDQVGQQAESLQATD